MQTTVLFLVKIALLILLWLFIALSLRALKRDASQTQAPAGAASALVAGGRSGGSRKSKSDGRNDIPAALVSTNGPEAGTSIDLTQVSDVTIGRSRNCTFIIADDYASSRHAHLFKRGHDWYVEDLQSRNGTFINEQNIDQPEHVNRGDVIRVGRTTLQVQ